MADTQLLKALSQGLQAGLTEQQVKEKLTKQGWTVQDVNGAYALHQLSLKPVGSNLITNWNETELEKSGRVVAGLFKVLLLALILLGLVSILDWRGYEVPFFGQYKIRSFVEGHVDMSYFSTSAQAFQPASSSTSSIK